MLRTFCVVVSLIMANSSIAQDDAVIFDSLICEFAAYEGAEESIGEFVIEADLKSEHMFFEEGTFTFDGRTDFLSLSQKRTQGAELYHFVLDEDGEDDPIRVRVFKTPGEDKVATASFMGEEFRGYCVLI